MGTAASAVPERSSAAVPQRMPLFGFCKKHRLQVATSLRRFYDLRRSLPLPYWAMISSRTGILVDPLAPHSLALTRKESSHVRKDARH